MTGFTETSVGWIVSGFSFWGMVTRSSIAIALAIGACSLLRRQSAAVRHRILIVGLAATLVVPLASHLLPQFAFYSLPDFANHFPELNGESSSSANVGVPRREPDGTVAGRGTVPRPEHEYAARVISNVDISNRNRMAEPAPSLAMADMGFEQWLILCWLTGASLWLSMSMVLWVRQSRELWRLPRVDDFDWDESIANAARALGLTRPIVTLESNDRCVPTVAGVFVARLVVPCDWRTWTATQRRCVLLHELAHVERRDVSTQLIGRLVQLVYWFNPLVWYAVRRLRAERELACDDSVVRAGQTPSDYAEQLLQMLQRYRPVRSVMGVAMAHSSRLDHRVMAILDPQRRRSPVSSRCAIALPCLAALICLALSTTTVSQTAMAQPSPESTADKPDSNQAPVWKETFTVEYPGTLPVSAVFSADGEVLLTGDTSGELMAVVFKDDSALWRWKAQVEGSHAAVAFSADQKQVYATTENGVRILDASTGKAQHLIEEKDSNPRAIGVFPEKKITDDYSRSQIVFGTPRGYFIKSWAKGHLPNTVGTIQTTTVEEGKEPPDAAGVPLAVDPKGRSAIMTGPIDGTGQITGQKGKNVLWAYVCGDYSEGSPGNRVMVGHEAPVVSAAWAKEGSTAVTGDAAGRVIVWDAATMKESSRVELGRRVAALAISDDGTQTAACILGEQGKVFVWETANPPDAMQPIHTDKTDFSAPQSYASLSFSADGRRLAGCALDRRWLNRLGELIGQVHVWELTTEE